MSLYSDQDQNFDELQSCPVVHSIISRQTWPINGLLEAQEYSIFINLCAEIFWITYQALCSKTFVGSERKRFPNWGREREQSSSAILGESRTDQSARGLRTNTPDPDRPCARRIQCKWAGEARLGVRVVAGEGKGVRITFHSGKINWSFYNSRELTLTFHFSNLRNWWKVHSAANDPRAQMIPRPEMIPNRKWSPMWTANDLGQKTRNDMEFCVLDFFLIFQICSFSCLANCERMVW